MLHMEDIERLKNKVSIILNSVDITPKKNIYYGNEDGGGSLEINILKNANEWHWQEIERGHIQRDTITTNEDEILFWIIKHCVESKAGEDINWTPRSKQKDPRKTWFNNSIKIMNEINLDWAKKIKKEYDQYL